MSTPTGPRDEAVEGPVQHLLWRLRARLVTPPAEERVHADLERLHAIARAHAHEAPAAMAGPTVPIATFPSPVTGTAVGASDRAEVAAQGVVVQGRFMRVADRVGRVAAVLLLIVGVGGGVGAMGRGGDTIMPTIFGVNGAQQPAAPQTGDTDLAIAPAPESTTATGEIDEPSAADVETSPAAPSEDTSAGQSGSSSADPTAAPGQSGSNGSGSTGSGSGSTGNATTGTGSGGSGSGGGSSPAPNAGSTSSPSPTTSPTNGGTSSPTPTDSPEASEPPREGSGFDGAGRPCPTSSPNESDKDNEGDKDDKDGDAKDGEATDDKPSKSCSPSPSPTTSPSPDPSESEKDDDGDASGSGSADEDEDEDGKDGASDDEPYHRD